jgi:hypothetical protein
MSFREKSAWISLLSMAGIYGLYFWSVIHAGPQAGRFHFGKLLGTIIALVVVQIVLHITMRVAYSGLATAVAFACFFGALNPPIVFNTNALLFILVTTEIMRSACLIIQYRRGA